MSKDFDYVVTLRKNTVKPVNIVCHILMLLSILVFVYALAREHQVGVNNDYRLMVITALAIVWWALILFSKKRKPYFRIGFFIVALGWFFNPLHNILIGIFYVLAALLEKQVKFPAEIGIDSEGVLLNTLPKKSFLWKEIRNVVIKDNLLTIDFKNNKLLQKEISEDVPYDMEKEFNGFCKGQLDKTNGVA